MAFPAPEPLVTESAFQDRTDRFPLDELMREAGFVIYLRPHGEALWKTEDGVVMREQDALVIAKRYAAKRRQQREQA